MKYSFFSRVLHWSMALIITFMIFLGLFMGEISKESEYRMTVYNFHKSIGVLVIFLIIIRLINRFINKPPTLQDSISKIERILANIAHKLMYLLMFLIPISGYLMSNSYGFPVSFFSFEMPVIVNTNIENAKLFSEAHEFLSFFLLFIIIFHVVAVIKHRFFDKKENDVLKRMI